MRSFLSIFLLISILSMSRIAFSSSTVGTFVSVKGAVKVLSLTKRKKMKKKLKFSGETYFYRKAKLGEKVRASDLIHTGPTGKAKLVYPNGDHLLIGPSSVISVPQVKGKEDDGQIMNIIYGKVRSVLGKKSGSKKEPFHVKTSTAVVGVRGTDFYVRSSLSGETTVAVLRGQVSVAKASDEAAEQELVSTGYSTNVSETSVEEPYRTLSSELQRVYRESIVSGPPQEIPDGLKAEFLKLEKAATTAIMQDIQAEDPELFQRLSGAEVSSSDELNQKVVTDSIRRAPKRREQSTESHDKFFEVE